MASVTGREGSKFALEGHQEGVRTDYADSFATAPEYTADDLYGVQYLGGGMVRAELSVEEWSEVRMRRMHARLRNGATESIRHAEGVEDVDLGALESGLLAHILNLHTPDTNMAMAAPTPQPTSEAGAGTTEGSTDGQAEGELEAAPNKGRTLVQAMDAGASEGYAAFGRGFKALGCCGPRTKGRVHGWWDGRRLYELGAGGTVKLLFGLLLLAIVASWRLAKSQAKEHWPGLIYGFLTVFCLWLTGMTPKQYLAEKGEDTHV
ncbi:hypothetical protein CALCODRAFT_479128 [Calocera cornea HHB12733]|uniref:Uncharacterized protein n=1 Tax=Calocera cornea HHB12733 TaxID=1353952 RepID=A0A165K1F4_9BASI|nr:hypothetical protein CALCODRAFT_479128 [Calocera cornea HHB12733]